MPRSRRCTGTCGETWRRTSEHYEDLKAGRLKGWRDFDPEQIRASGQHEVLNWVCLAGAMEDRTPEVAAWAPSYIFNSSKCIAIFRPEAARSVREGTALHPFLGRLL